METEKGNKVKDIGQQQQQQQQYLLLLYYIIGFYRG
jgi:hypothetical protein